MSIVGGPPPSQINIADLFAFTIAGALARNVRVKANAGSAKAEAPAKCRIKCRRDMPDGIVQQLSMIKPRTEEVNFKCQMPNF
jgi:hypothetical protein